MSGPLLHVGATAQCPHGAPATIVPAQTRVLVGGQPVAVMNAVITVAGCPFTLPLVPPKPSPCILARWMNPAARVLVGGQPAALAPGPSLTQSPEQLPQGALLLAQVQTRVIGS